VTEQEPLSEAAIEQRRAAPTTHGFYTRNPSALRDRCRKTQSLVRKARHVMSWLDKSDLPTLRAWAELEILGATAFSDLANNGTQ
jgi:hypothetical protein